MQFAPAVDRLVSDASHRSAAQDWWSELLQEEESSPLVRNIEGDMLFEGCPQAGSHVRGFAAGLASSRVHSDPVVAARQAINDRGCMVCADPEAMLSQADAQVCRVATVLTVYRFLSNQAARTVLPNAQAARRAFLRKWAKDLGDPGAYTKKLDGRNTVRGALPNAFWTPSSDLARLGPNASAARVRQFLGLEPVPNVDAHVIIGTRVDATLVMFVPTGWDAFDNPFFVPQPPGAQVGWTQDLASGVRGGREVVTAPVLVSRTLPVRILL